LATAYEQYEQVVRNQSQWHGSEASALQWLVRGFTNLRVVDAGAAASCVAAADDVPEEEGRNATLGERGHPANTIRRELPWFARLSTTVRDAAGSPKFSALLVLAVLAWLAAAHSWTSQRRGS
jgi:hypothetical protein